MAHNEAEPAHPRVNDADKTMAREGELQGSPTSRNDIAEDVGQLADALRAAKRAHIEHLAELWQADVEPAEDWATWYAEYLLGVR
jgi:hypothetical protein